MILPTKAKISYKASCFCHRNQVDIGYVCSVCLSSRFRIELINTRITKFLFFFDCTSVFCQFNPICSTCQTGNQTIRLGILYKISSTRTFVERPIVEFLYNLTFTSHFCLNLIILHSLITQYSN